MRLSLRLASAAIICIAILVSIHAEDKGVRLDETQRIAVIAKVRPAVVAIYARGGQGGGSGVLIDKEGYALTNFHVVQGSGPVMQCGLPDGILYDAVLVGLDKVGDVALVRLLPKKEGQPFPFAPLGDSEQTKEGDWSLAMGNPFLLATDFTPTVTFGLVSGVHRYQYPEGTLLEYTDCIQIDTSINPGNSGGPLFNMKGELIGINGRGSFDKRARINSGVGYAISINQIKNFMGHLRAGLDTDHATLGAIVRSQSEDLQRLEVQDVQDDSDAFRRGLAIGDELISFAGRPMQTVNEFKNVLGVFPKEWRLPLTYRSQQKRKETLVRLMGLQVKEQEDPNKPPPGTPVPPKPVIPEGPAKRMYIEKKGYANYYFNDMHQSLLMEAFHKNGEFSKLKGEWTIEGEMELKTRKAPVHVVMGEKEVEGANVHPLIQYFTDTTNYTIDPLATAKDDLKVPTGSGGLLLALFHYKLLLTEGVKGFAQDRTFHAGNEPIYPYPVDGSTPKNLKDLRVDTEVLKSEYGAVAAKWFFSKTDHKLLEAELWIENTADPCELYFSDYKPVDGRQLPHRIEVRFGDERFGVFTVKNYKMKSK